MSSLFKYDECETIIFNRNSSIKIYNIIKKVMNMYDQNKYFNYKIYKSNGTSLYITKFIIRALKDSHTGEYDYISLLLYPDDKVANIITFSIVDGDIIEMLTNGIIINHKNSENYNTKETILHYVS